MTAELPDPIDCAALREHVRALDEALTAWARRDDSQPRPEVRAAANTAVAELDAALGELHRLRNGLAAQTREFDDATARRVDALLAERRGQACLHAQDARHRSMYGPPVYVGCGCSEPCCATAEQGAGSARGEVAP